CLCGYLFLTARTYKKIRSCVLPDRAFEMVTLTNFGKLLSAIIICAVPLAVIALAACSDGRLCSIIGPKADEHVTVVPRQPRTLLTPTAEARAQVGLEKEATLSLTSFGTMSEQRSMEIASTEPRYKAHQDVEQRCYAVLGPRWRDENCQAL